MDRHEFLERIELADRQLAEEHVPIYDRWLRVFRLLAPDYVGLLLGYHVNREDYPEFVGPNLLEHIDTWYKERYGERVYAPTPLGKVPLIIRGEVYLIRVPLAFGEPEVPVLPLIEGLTPQMSSVLTTQECEVIRKIFENGYKLIYDMEGLKVCLKPTPKISLSHEGLQILESAFEDRDTAMRCLSGRLDTNGACFHAQQHTEKMLKVFLIAKNIYTPEQLRIHPFGII